MRSKKVFVYISINFEFKDADAYHCINYAGLQTIFLKCMFIFDTFIALRMKCVLLFQDVEFKYHLLRGNE